jgi:hypothetical protein
MNISRVLFNYDPKQYLHPGTNSLSIRFHLPALSEIIRKELIVGKARTKILSTKILNLPLVYVSEFLRGYIDGDGYIDAKNGKMTVVSASKNMLNQVNYILTRYKVVPSIGSYLQKGGPTHRDREFVSIRLQVGSIGTKILSKHIKGEKFGNIKSFNREWNHSYFCDGYLESHITNWDEKFFEGFVYNLETESHTYIANNVIVHNCNHLKPGRKGALTIVSANDIRDMLDKELLRPEWLKHLVASKFDVDEILKGASRKGVAVRNAEINHKTSFFELSIVATPAFFRADQLEKLARMQSEDRKEYLKRIANEFGNDDVLELYSILQDRGLISNQCGVS